MKFRSFNNRKGDVATFMIIPVAFILIVLAFYSFLTYDRQVKNFSKDVSEVIGDINFYEQYVKAEAESIALESVSARNIDKYKEIAKERDLQIESGGNFFGKIRNGEFIFEKKGDKYVLEIKDLFVQSERGANKMKRNFDIYLEFFVENKP